MRIEEIFESLKNRMFRKIFTIVIILFFIAFFTQFFIEDIAFRIVGFNRESLDTPMDLEELLKFQEARTMGRDFYFFYAFYAICTIVISAAVLKHRLFSPRYIPKTLLIIGILWLLFLEALNGINFIPGPPIR